MDVSTTFYSHLNEILILFYSSLIIEFDSKCIILFYYFYFNMLFVVLLFFFLLYCIILFQFDKKEVVKFNYNILTNIHPSLPLTHS